ncbi:hypothetical protein AB0M92_37715 [Streptomyces sp. NPDC051582]|uniref:hypothetical protein n=1 Tax=Streptomyces sp. NPDC051582 TaxID=3155167 RepID=UPI003440FE7E
MDIPITARKAARIAVARNAGINMNPVRECTNADRAAWASEALEAYNQHAPTTLLPVPERTERVRLGVLAAEAMAQVAFNHPGDQVVDDQESADRVIGDLVAQLFCLTDGRVSSRDLYQAAEELRSEAYPVHLTAVCAVVAAGAEREAGMLAALLDAAQSFGCDVPGLVASARDYFEDLKAEEADAASS